MSDNVSDDFKRKINNAIYPRRSAYLAREAGRQAEFQRQVQSSQEPKKEE